MKVQGLDNTISQSGNCRKIQKSIERSSAISVGAKTTGKNEFPKGLVSSRPATIEQTSSRKDVIELIANRAAASESDGFFSSVDIKDSIRTGGQSQSSIYSVESISSTARGANDISRRAHIVNIRQKVADGYYNSPEFIEKLADTLIDKLYLTGESE